LLAKEQAVPAYVIFPDRTLVDMARTKPRTAADLARVHGVGEAKLRRYGEVFLGVIRAYLPSAADGQQAGAS
jgi:ATP-dependent DNA helicase RecQ